MEKESVEREMGRKAFHRGVNAPVLDREFMKHLKDLTSGQPVGSSLPLLTEWEKGWTEENLKEKFPEESLNEEGAPGMSDDEPGM